MPPRAPKAKRGAKDNEKSPRKKQKIAKGDSESQNYSDMLKSKRLFPYDIVVKGESGLN